MPNDDSREQLREKYYRRGIENEQERLNQIFSKLGDINQESQVLNFIQSEYETLDKVRNGVESGDRKAMLVLIVIVADALHAFETLPKDVRNALADGLEKMCSNLYRARGFLPIKRGESSECEMQIQSHKEHWTALSVESHRFYDGDKLDEAIEKVAEEKRLTESLVQKNWKKQHKAARKTLEMVSSITKRPKKQVVSKPRRKR